MTDSTGSAGSLVSASTRVNVLARDGNLCWLCDEGPATFLQVAHQIPAAALELD